MEQKVIFRCTSLRLANYLILCGFGSWIMCSIDGRKGKGMEETLAEDRLYDLYAACQNLNRL